MLLSIVIPSHNRPDLLRLCLASVRTHAPTAQVIVVDDGSKDCVVAHVAESFADVVRHERPMGFAVAANRGIERATGSVVELLNDDTQVSAGWAESALAAFADPTIAAVAPLVLQGVPSDKAHAVIDSAGDEYDRGGFARKRGHGQRLTDGYLQPCEVFGASASSAFYRADVLRTVGAFPESFGAYFEDVDLSWRIRRAGYRAMYEPGSVIWHRVGSSYRKRRELLERQSRNEELVFWRNVPRVGRALPRHAAVLAAKSIRRVREGTFVPFAIGRLRALAEFKAWFRSPIPIRRRVGG